MDSRKKKIYLATLWGSIANVVLTVFKLFAGIVGGSAAMLADAIHSLSDFLTDIVVFLFVRLSSQPHDEDHGWGHGKYETLATALIALLLFGVGIGLMWDGVMAVWGSCHGHALPTPEPIALYAAVVSILVKEGLYWYTLVQARITQSSALKANAWHHRSDALSSVGTMVGIGGAIYLGDGWQVLDPIAAIIVSVLIIRVAVKLLRPAMEELLEKSLPQEEHQRILQMIETEPGVSHPHNLRTRRIGAYCAIDVHVRMAPETPLVIAHQATRHIEDRLREAYGTNTYISIHVEPVKN